MHHLPHTTCPNRSVLQTESPHGEYNEVGPPVVFNLQKGQTLIPLDISVDPGGALRCFFEGKNPIRPAYRHQNSAHSNRHTPLLFCYWIKDREHGLENSLLSPGEWGRLDRLERSLAD